MATPVITPVMDQSPNRTRRQRNARLLLALHPFLLELRGPMRDITWPSLCPNCGATASEVLEVPKVFLRFPRPNGYSRPSTGIYWKEVARFPFCADCAALHHSLVDRPSFSRQVLRTLLTPLMIPVVGSLWMLSITLPQALDVAPRVTNANEAMIAWGLVVLPMFIIVWTLVLAWRSSLHDRIEKQTEVTRACDYSGDVSDFLERERRLFAIRDRAFAEALLQLNSDRVWTAEDDARSGRRRLLVFMTFVLLAAGVWLYVVLAPMPS